MKNWRDDSKCRMIYDAAIRLNNKSLDITSYSIKTELSLDNTYHTPTPREIGNYIKRIDALVFSGCVDMKNNKGHKYIINKYVFKE